MRHLKARLRRGLNNLALVVGSILLLFVLLNVVSTVFFHKRSPLLIQKVIIHRDSKFPGVRYEHIPGVKAFSDGVEVKINSYGFRDNDFLLEKPDGLCRIVALGDSLTFGQGVVLEDTYAKQLERMLNQTGPHSIRFEVLNAGVQGYNTVQEASVLRYRILPLKPDLLILGFTEGNDPELESFHPFSFADLIGESSAFRHLPVSPYLLRWVDQTIASLLWYRYTIDIYRPEGKPWKACVQALEGIRNICQENGIALVVVCFPVLHPKEIYKKQRIQLKDSLERFKISYLDSYPVIRDIPRPKMHVSDMDSHPSVLVHRRFAELLYGWILENPPCKVAVN